MKSNLMRAILFKGGMEMQAREGRRKGGVRRRRGRDGGEGSVVGGGEERMQA